VFCKIRNEFLNYKLNKGSLQTADSTQYTSHKEKYNMMTKTTKIDIKWRCALYSAIHVTKTYSSELAPVTAWQRPTAKCPL